MRLPSHLGHWVGVAGEALNFFGALILALDLLLRRREQPLKETLSVATKWARKFDLQATFKGVPLTVSDFVERVLARSAARLGYVGIGFLAVGFLLLVGHHLIAIYYGE
jgi:hypothetical protein